jgi:SAM-dependent methyltransferase
MRDELRDSNRKNWDARARVHARSQFYDLDGFASGQRRLSLKPWEPDEVGDVTGKSLCQLQCHLGVETLSWARLGAGRVVGLDFSAEAIETARALAARCALTDRATFVEADVHDAPRALGGHAPFDIVYVSVGAICWLPEVKRWAAVVRGLLAPGGMLYMHEVHPMLGCIEQRDGRLEVERPYFECAEPIRWDDGTTYTEGHPTIEHKVCYEWTHGLGEIIQALLDEGLSLELLREHRAAEFQPLPSMQRGDDGLWRLPPELRDRVPLTYTLRARLR